MVIRFICAFLFLLAPALAQQVAIAAAAPAGNLPAGFYVKSDCQKPQPPTLPKPDYNDRAGVELYNLAVQRYNEKSKAFDACINGYDDKASTDIAWIRFTVNTVAAKANGSAPPSPPAAPGNMPAGFYPSPDCTRPDKQFGTAPSTSDKKAMDAYNAKVAAFNGLAMRFNDCLRDYSARANTDIERIEQAEKEAALQAGTILATSAETPQVPTQAPPLPTENITVTGTKSRQALDSFAKAFTTPTKLTGKIARWERGICPTAIGQKPAFTSFITERAKYIAQAVGAPVNSQPSCTPNIEIVFTTTPQALLDGVRKDNPDYLGYATTSEQRDELAKVTRPVQAWYTTETVDQDGVARIDTGRRTGQGIAVSNYGAFAMPSSSGVNRQPFYFPDATYAAVTGNRVNDGTHSGFNHILIVIDSTKLAGQKIVPLADYIAMLALTQLNSPNSCQELSSIVNLLAKDCDQKAEGITLYDLAYLEGLYKMGTDKGLLFQQDDITDAMVDRLEQGK